jgi:exosortase D (VPLPA-CTERM-specific)
MSIQAIETTHTNRAGLVGLVGLVVGTLIALVVFSDALVQLANRWATHEEYSHGFLIPIVTVWLFWTRRDALRANAGRSVWIGPIVMLLATIMNVIGEMTAIFVLSQVGFVLAIVGLVLALGGYPLLRTAFFPILFLLFAIPMPGFIDDMLSLKLQLVSSELGALFIRMFRIPVYLEGNVIDLGYYKLQIVEACSGLRYVYPLLSLSFLAAYLFKAPLWQRAMVFFSAIPLTIVMNSFRIALVGVAVNYWGPQAADGFLHLFEGWIIFLSCAGILAFEIHILARIFGKSLYEVFYLPKITFKLPRGHQAEAGNQAPLVASLLLLCVTGLGAFHISSRSEIIPDRSRFIAFPERIGPWQGRTSLLEPETERKLRLDDYILSDYRGSDGNNVNLYVAYYASQRKGNQPHSPNDCIPASGWKITKFERTSYTDNGAKFPLNRVIIEKNSVKQAVYYWFDERGRKIANEYLARWFIHADAALMNRTDGALVRLVTQIHGGETEYDADKRLQAFLHDALPTLSQYLPSEVIPQVNLVRFGSTSTQLE